MKLLSSAFTVLSLSVRSSGFAPGRFPSSTRRNNVVTEWKSSSMTSQTSSIDRLLFPAFRPFHCAASSSSDNIDAVSDSPVVTLVGDDLQEHGYNKWFDSVVASDGCVYGIPCRPCRVIKFDPKDNSTTTIGDDLGCVIYKCWEGVEANNGCIYAVPRSREPYILKIDIQRQAVEKVDAELPQSNEHVRWGEDIRWGRGALGDDECIYFFPKYADRILKLDPSNDTVSSVGFNLQTKPDGKKESLFSGTAKVDDGCLIGIPNNSKRIIKFDPKEPHTATMVGEEAEEGFKCWGNGALGGDGDVYAVTRFGKILQIDVANNRHSFVAEAPESRWCGWCGAVTGMDGNIYFPPDYASRVLKYDITTQQASLVGDDLGDGDDKYRGGALNPIDGKIYCLPDKAGRVLSIDTNVAPQSCQNSAEATLGHTIQYGEDDDVKNLAPHIENHVIINAGGHNGAGRGDRPSTMQRLLQVIEVVERVRGMDHPHPTFMANADRMAEAFTVLTDRFIKEVQNEN